MSDPPKDRPDADGSPTDDGDHSAANDVEGAESNGTEATESIDADDPPTTDVASSSDAADGEFDDPPIYESSGSGLHARDVEVPMRVYKTVTVFSTLIAVVCVLAGFVLLDRATERAQLPLSQVDPVLAFLGIGVILFGAGTYAFATRFRAAGMGSSKNDDDESADNG